MMLAPLLSPFTISISMLVTLPHILTLRALRIFASTDSTKQDASSCTEARENDVAYERASPRAEERVAVFVLVALSARGAVVFEGSIGIVSAMAMAPAR
jgi:hypothetical protein